MLVLIDGCSINAASLLPQKILSEHSGPGSSRHNPPGRARSLLCGGHAALENPRAALSPLTNSLLEQLEARIKELKTWLRDTELLIFNSCLKEHKDASEQLQSFKVRRPHCWLWVRRASGSGHFRLELSLTPPPELASELQWPTAPTWSLVHLHTLDL